MLSELWFIDTGKTPAAWSGSTGTRKKAENDSKLYYINYHNHIEETIDSDAYSVS